MQQKCPHCEGETVDVPGQCCPDCILTTQMAPEMPTSTISCCEYDGKTYSVGESFSPDPCSYCTCEADGETLCMQAGCPYCEGETVDAPGRCCPDCIPTTQNTPEMPTSTISCCEYEGKTYSVGESFSPDPCSYCTCEADGEPLCMRTGCPYCEGETVDVPGRCCPDCIPTTPNTPGMSIYCVDNGNTYQIGESFYPNPCTYCYCEEGGQLQCAYAGCPTCSGYTVDVPGQCCPKCYPEPPEIPTSTPVSCQNNGQTYSIGEGYTLDACTECMCESSGPQCYIRDCARPECDDYYFVKDECCPKCPPETGIRNTPSYETPGQTEEVTEQPTSTTSYCEYNGKTYS
ncbi:unnamed protein product, partial [Lymnaea stagnalis]